MTDPYPIVAAKYLWSYKWCYKNQICGTKIIFKYLKTQSGKKNVRLSTHKC